MKIILVSDNHGDTYSINYLKKKYKDLAYRVHCGDNALLPEQMEGFEAVAGNMDWFPYPEEIILEIEGHRILVLHGHRLFPSYRPDHDILVHECESAHTSYYSVVNSGAWVQQW